MQGWADKDIQQPISTVVLFVPSENVSDSWEKDCRSKDQ